MSKHIVVKGDNMDLSTITLFNNLSDEDFLAIHNAGQLKNLCLALTLDLQSIKDEKIKTNNTYTA